MGEPTDSSGVHGGDEEGNSEKLEVEHGNVDGGVPTGWLMSSAGIRSPFYALFYFLRAAEGRCWTYRFLFTMFLK